MNVTTPSAKGVVFSITDYVLSHGKKPSGRGSWAFSFGNRDSDAADPALFWTPGSTLFSAAKEMAAKEAARRGFSGIIYVCT